MIIQCTKKVLDKLGIKDAEKAPNTTSPGNEEMKAMLNWSKITRADEKTDEEINRSLSWIK